ncbi:MAG: class I SAM-dependent methyltransferase [Betaproteobacteria bacterium]|nr:class I SAM-dependent methyltransferase [Betaproteobacteria bacterium]
MEQQIVSEEYQKQLKKLHELTESFGVGNVTKKHYAHIEMLISKKSYKSVLDYGCGKGDFIEYIKSRHSEIVIDGFDVASDEYNTMPSGRYDLIVSLDVMEHVEFGALGAVLSEIRSRCEKQFVCSIANYPAAKNLPDGRNAHVTQLPFGTWFQILSNFFRIDQFVRTGKKEGFFVSSRLETSSDWR